MTPRGLPAGRIGLVSPSGIGGASPRHTLTSPVMAGQGRQVSVWKISIVTDMDAVFKRPLVLKEKQFYFRYQFKNDSLEVDLMCLNGLCSSQ